MEHNRLTHNNKQTNPHPSNNITNQIRIGQLNLQNSANVTSESRLVIKEMKLDILMRQNHFFRGNDGNINGNLTTGQQQSGPAS